MRMTQLFTRTLKQAPAGEVARNAQLLIRAGRRLFFLAAWSAGA